jgi:hypothetical protein
MSTLPHPRRRRLALLAAALVALTFATGACSPQFFGASNLGLSTAHTAYSGPVHANAGYTPTQGQQVVSAHVDDQTGPVVIVDYEHNGVTSDGLWTVTGPASDHNAAAAMIFATERCTVWVLGTRYDAHSAQLQVARADIVELMTQRAALGFPTVVADLATVLTPQDVSADGVHLTTAAAAAKYHDTLEQAQEDCP